MAFESTNAILGVKSLEEQKKSNRWSKWMDIANLLQNTAGMGADIWKTISGRKHDFGLASVGQGYAKETMGLQFDYDKQLRDIDARIAEAKANGDLEREKQLEDKRAEVTAARDSRLHGYALSEISAQRGVDKNSPEYQKILDDKVAWIIELAKDRFGMKDELGNPIWNPGVTDRATLERFLRDQYEADPTWDDADRKYFERALMSMLDGGVGLGGPEPVAKGEGAKSESVELGELKTSYQNMFRMMADRTRALDTKGGTGVLMAATNQRKNDLLNVLNELDDFAIDPNDLASVREKIDLIGTGSTRSGIESMKQYAEKTFNDAKTALDTIIKKYKLLNEIFAPQGP